MSAVQHEYATVDGYSGVAWFVSLFQDVEGRIVCVMVGDDRRFDFDPDEVHPLDREAFCGECGQVGCTHDGIAR